MKQFIALLSFILLFALTEVKADNQNYGATETVVLQTHNLDFEAITLNAVANQIQNSINRELEQVFVCIPVNLNIEKPGIKTSFGDNIILDKFRVRSQKTKELNTENKFIIAQKDYTEIGNSKSYLCSRHSVVYDNYSEKIITKKCFGSINKLLTKNPLKEENI